MSGVQVTDRVKGLFDEMRTIKNEEGRIRIALFQLIDETVIDIIETITQEGLKNYGIPTQAQMPTQIPTQAQISTQAQDPYKVIKDLLKEDVCYYILYDCHYVTKEGLKKEDLVFITWVPDSAPVKRKMMYASSKRGIKSCFMGLKHDLEMHEVDDFFPRMAFADQLTKNQTSVKIVEIEGVKVA